MSTGGFLSDLVEYDVQDICFQVGSGQIENGFAIISFDPSTNTTTTDIVNAALNLVPGAVVVPCPSVLTDEVKIRQIIWAEENGGLSDNSREYSFGNGATGQIGIPMYEHCRIVGMVYQAESPGAGTTTVAVEVDLTIVGQITLPGNQTTAITTFATPVNVLAGQTIGFQTIQGGNASDVRVGAVVEYTQIVDGLQGPPGVDGGPVPPGGTSGQILVKNSTTDGDVSWQNQATAGTVQVARIRTNITGDIGDDNTWRLITWNNTPTLNTISSLNVSGDTITLPTGLYRMDFRPSVTAGDDDVNCEWDLRIDASSYQEFSGSNFINDAGGHNEAGDSICDVFEITGASGTLQIRSRGQANNDPVFMDNSRSLLLITKYS